MSVLQKRRNTSNAPSLTAAAVATSSRRSSKKSKYSAHRMILISILTIFIACAMFFMFQTWTININGRSDKEGRPTLFENENKVIPPVQKPADDQVPNEKKLVQKKPEPEEPKQPVKQDIVADPEPSNEEKPVEKKRDVVEDKTVAQKKKSDYPPPMPSSEKIELSTDDYSVADIDGFVEQFWGKDNSKIMEVPSADEDGLVYVTNAILLPAQNMLTIFLLPKKFMDPKRNKHAWKTRYRNNVPQVYDTLNETLIPDYKKAVPAFSCVFPANNDELPHIYYVSQVDYVPNHTTRDSNVDGSVEVLRCEIPMSEMDLKWDDPNTELSFLLTQRSDDLLSYSSSFNKGRRLLDENESSKKLVNVKLAMKVGMRSAVSLYTNDKPFIYPLASAATHRHSERTLSYCLSPTSDILPFISENIAHHLKMGVQHIYIGTHFKWDTRDEYRQQLIDRVKPWYEAGRVTIWPNEQPWLEFSYKAQPHWLNQCLYYAKDRDAYSLAVDTDEFILLNQFEKEMNNATDNLPLKEMPVSPLITLLNESTTKAEYCWLSFHSVQIVKLWHPTATLMVERFSGRENGTNHVWSKVIWNNEALWYTGIHAGGACSAQNHNWAQTINGFIHEEESKYVYRFNADSEARSWHFVNSVGIRRTSNVVINDTTMLDIYAPLIRDSFKQLGINDTYPKDA